jgi:hypothetical protein
MQANRALGTKCHAGCEFVDTRGRAGYPGRIFKRVGRLEWADCDHSALREGIAAQEQRGDGGLHLSGSQLQIEEMRLKICAPVRRTNCNAGGLRSTGSPNGVAGNELTELVVDGGGLAEKAARLDRAPREQRLVEIQGGVIPCRRAGVLGPSGGRFSSRITPALAAESPAGASSASISDRSQPELGTNAVSLRAPGRPLRGSMAILGHLGLNIVQKSKENAKDPLNAAH